MMATTTNTADIMDVVELEKLIHELVFENQQYVKMIEKENQMIESLDADIKRKKVETEKLDADLSRLDDGVNKMHKQYTHNQDNITSLKRTLSVMSDHEMALSRQDESQKTKTAEDRKFYKENLTNYTKIKDDYMRKYQDFPLAITLERKKQELAIIQEEADKRDKQISDLKNQIAEKEAELETKIASRIVVKMAKIKCSSLETDKEIHKCVKEKTTLLEKLKEIQRTKQPSEINAAKDPDSQNLSEMSDVQKHMENDVQHTFEQNLPKLAKLSMEETCIDNPESRQVDQTKAITYANKRSAEVVTETDENVSQNLAVDSIQVQSTENAVAHKENTHTETESGNNCSDIITSKQGKHEESSNMPSLKKQEAVSRSFYTSKLSLLGTKPTMPSFTKAAGTSITAVTSTHRNLNDSCSESTKESKNVYSGNLRLRIPKLTMPSMPQKPTFPRVPTQLFKLNAQGSTNQTPVNVAETTQHLNLPRLRSVTSGKPNQSTPLMLTCPLMPKMQTEVIRSQISQAETMSHLTTPSSILRTAQTSNAEKEVCGTNSVQQPSASLSTSQAVTQEYQGKDKISEEKTDLSLKLVSNKGDAPCEADLNLPLFKPISLRDSPKKQASTPPTPGSGSFTFNWNYGQNEEESNQGTLADLFKFGTSIGSVGSPSDNEVGNVSSFFSNFGKFGEDVDSPLKTDKPSSLFNLLSRSQDSDNANFSLDFSQGENLSEKDDGTEKTSSFFNLVNCSENEDNGDKDFINFSLTGEYNGEETTFKKLF